MNKENKMVAIESTQDYTDKDFHTNYVDVDVKNADGSWGRIEDYYRIVDLHDDGWVKAFDDRVFKSADEAKAAVAQDKSLKLVSYDAIINEAGKIRTAKVLEKLAQSNKKSQDVWKPKPDNSKEKAKGVGMDR